MISDVAGFVNDEASSVESATVKLHSDDGEDEDTKEDQDADLQQRHDSAEKREHDNLQIGMYGSFNTLPRPLCISKFDLVKDEPIVNMPISLR